MNPLVRKEARMLLPPWIAALVVATTPLWSWNPIKSVAPWLFGVAILALGLSPFGMEINSPWPWVLPGRCMRGADGVRRCPCRMI